MGLLNMFSKYHFSLKFIFCLAVTSMGKPPLTYGMSFDLHKEGLCPPVTITGAVDAFLFHLGFLSCSVWGTIFEYLWFTFDCYDHIIDNPLPVSIMKGKCCRDFHLFN